MEPWRGFRVLDSGVRRDKISFTPLRMFDEKLMYEEEIPPGVCRSIIKTLRENIDDKVVVKKVLNILYELPFNNKCNMTDHNFEITTKLR